MFEKIGQSAEKVVNKVSVSRRGFLGSAAKLAAGVGAALTGLLGASSEAQAGTGHYCRYWCVPDSPWVPGFYYTVFQKGNGPCKEFIQRDRWTYCSLVS
jgi:hypothetical protein